MIALDVHSTDYCGDFSNPEGVAETVGSIRPDIIVNAAAHTAVDKADQNRSLHNYLTRQVSKRLRKQPMKSAPGLFTTLLTTYFRGPVKYHGRRRCNRTAKCLR
ncbi:sugar nucleotide-binding protein [Escherichia coli]